MTLDAHGVRITLPDGWSGHVFRRPGDIATLHAGDFALAIPDGEFGDRSTAAMPAGATFLALTEYLPGRGLAAGQGLFAPSRIPLPLDPTGFSSRGLAHPRLGQAGVQHFFSTAARPWCLYVVVSGSRSVRARQLAVLGRVLRTLRIAPRM